MIAPSPRPNRPSLLGVLYAEDFDETGSNGMAAPDPVPEPEVIEPVFTAAELDAARAEASSAGQAAAERGLAGSRTQLLARLASTMEEAREGAREVAEQAAEGVARCMLGALAACLPSLCEQHGVAELRAFVRTLLPALTEEPRVIVRINPAMMAMMQSEIGSLDDEVAERVQLLATEAVPPGDARVTWSEGSAVRDTSRARAAFALGLAELGLLQPEQVNA
jgi:flagellar biosynthesis/type III secretory pathway protein FliH